MNELNWWPQQSRLSTPAQRFLGLPGMSVPSLTLRMSRVSAPCAGKSSRWGTLVMQDWVPQQCHDVWSASYVTVHKQENNLRLTENELTQWRELFDFEKLRVCPQCLSEWGYHTWYFQIIGLTVCPIHKCEFVTECRTCGYEYGSPHANQALADARLACQCHLQWLPQAIDGREIEFAEQLEELVSRFRKAVAEATDRYDQLKEWFPAWVDGHRKDCLHVMTAKQLLYDEEVNTKALSASECNGIRPTSLQTKTLASHSRKPAKPVCISPVDDWRITQQSMSDSIWVGMQFDMWRMPFFPKLVQRILAETEVYRDMYREAPDQPGICPVMATLQVWLVFWSGAATQTGDIDLRAIGKDEWRHALFVHRLIDDPLNRRFLSSNNPVADAHALSKRSSDKIETIMLGAFRQMLRIVIDREFKLTKSLHFDYFPIFVGDDNIAVPPPVRDDLPKIAYRPTTFGAARRKIESRFHGFHLPFSLEETAATRLRIGDQVLLEWD